MFGWEFPPFKSGGLGTACKDLTKGLDMEGVDVTFVMPVAPAGAESDSVKIIGTNNYARKIKIKTVKSCMTPYQNVESYEATYKDVFAGKTTGKEVYGESIFTEIERYALAAKEIAEDEDFDIIHAHDWMTYKAGLEAKKATGKPLVVHIHATEFDRTGGNPNHFISHREYEGMKGADLVIANSQFTKNNVLSAYNLEANKIKVVHWGIDPDNEIYSGDFKSPLKDDIVLFLGRITIQKGPDYFIEAARKVLDIRPNTKFVMAGSGDMLQRCINRAAELGMADRFFFTGFLKGQNVHKAFQMADLFVMPSVSEPFGLVALEALKNGTPILISNQSGVAEVVDHALKVNFWDTTSMANKIVSTLNYKELHRELKKNSVIEVEKFNLRDPAKKVKDHYEEVLV